MKQTKDLVQNACRCKCQTGVYFASQKENQSGESLLKSRPLLCENCK